MRSSSDGFLNPLHFGERGGGLLLFELCLHEALQLVSAQPAGHVHLRLPSGRVTVMVPFALLICP